MSVEELIIYGKKYLHSDEVKILLSSILGCNTLELLNHLDYKVSTEDVEKYKKMIDLKLSNYPIQYIVGNVNFYGFEFDINPGVLIPRFDTEQLVYYTLDFIKKNFSESIDIIDLGCGSGVIGITLSKMIHNSHVTCLDISDDALVLAEKNAKKLEAQVNIIKGDMLKNIIDKYDVIISNPPYIDYNDSEVEEIVKKHEPSTALYADNNGLSFYEEILKSSKKNLKEKFLIAFEIGYKQAQSVVDLANKYFDNINCDVYKDLSGKDRVVLIYSNNF